MLHELGKETIEYYSDFAPSERLDRSYIEKWRGRLPGSFLSL